jgi:hypothetical protein
MTVHMDAPRGRAFLPGLRHHLRRRSARGPRDDEEQWEEDAYRRSALPQVMAPDARDGARQEGALKRSQRRSRGFKSHHLQWLWIPDGTHLSRRRNWAFEAAAGVFAA